MSRASSRVKLSSKGVKSRHGEKKSNADLEVSLVTMATGQLGSTHGWHAMQCFDPVLSV